MFKVKNCARARAGFFSAVVVLCRERAAKNVLPHVRQVRVFARRTLAAHGSGGALIEIPHPHARVGCLCMRGASRLHR